MYEERIFRISYLGKQSRGDDNGIRFLGSRKKEKSLDFTNNNNNNRMDVTQKSGSLLTLWTTLVIRRDPPFVF